MWCRRPAVRSLCSAAAAVLLALQSSQPVLHSTQKFSLQASTTITTITCSPHNTPGQSTPTRPVSRLHQSKAQWSSSAWSLSTTMSDCHTTGSSPSSPSSSYTSQSYRRKLSLLVLGSTWLLWAGSFSTEDTKPSLLEDLLATTVQGRQNLLRLLRFLRLFQSFISLEMESVIMNHRETSLSPKIVIF